MAHTALDKDTFPAEQFEDAEQQYLTATMGMWSFLITEIMFIGAIFCAFFVYRMRWHGAFVEGAHVLLWKIATVNTVVLLTSSFTMVLAVHAARHGTKKQLVTWLIATLILGFGFVGIKCSEYYVEYKEQLIPGLNYSDTFTHTEGEHAGHTVTRSNEMKLFMTFYFSMTGLHAIHMLVGIGVLVAITIKAAKGAYSHEYNNPVDMFGLYWHFVDLVWVFLFPTLYLLRH